MKVHSSSLQNFGTEVCVQLRLSTKKIISKYKEFVKITTICFMFWKAFDKIFPEKLFIVKNEAFGK